MKKILLLGLTLLFGLQVNSQTPSKIPVQLLNKSEKMTIKTYGDQLPVILNESNPYLRPKTAKDLGIQIGITWYDLQGNSDVGNRMMAYPDGSITAVWTMATESAWTSRGTGYNHSTNDGTTWLPMPTVRIEGTIKTGWPNVGKTNSGMEVVVAHDFQVKANLCKSTDAGANWQNAPFGESVKLCWPRTVVTGNTIHVIGQTITTVPYMGYTAGALVYMRSTDNGANWTTPVIPTGLDTSNYAASTPFSDSYSLAGKGDTIVIFYGDTWRTPCLVKSTNNGNTWSYREILHLPIKKFDTEGSTVFDINGDAQQDNLFGDDGVNFVTLDKFGKAHCFFGRMCVTDDGSGAGWNYYPFTDGIYYWNEDMPTINFQFRWRDLNGINTYEGIPDTVNFPIITEIVDINNNGTIDFPDNGSNNPFGYYGCSLSSQPNAVISGSGTIFLFYSSIVEGTDGVVGSEHQAFRNLWEIHKYNGSSSWSSPVRIAEDDFTEEVWPCVSPKYTGSSTMNNGHLWYQGDGYPGNSLQPTPSPHPVVESQIYYIKYRLDNIGIKEINVLNNNPIIYPNPASNDVTVKYNLTDASNIKLSIYNMVGQQIMTSSKDVNAGENYVNLNIESLSKGVYYIKSDIGKQSYTNKLIVK